MDGHYLASCGLDGRVFVWDVTNGYALLRRLETEPRKPLKGLIWDPLGQYLAAQSNDGTLFVWRCLDWKLETFISSPYLQDEPAESYTYFSRPSWSPDGRVICLPDTLNETDTVAILVERSDWRCEQSLVGHKSAVQSASFSPCLYKAINNIGTHLLVALGAQDGTISIWSSEGERPLAVLAGTFEHAVMDLAWTPDGLGVYAASYDGTIACIRMDSTLIGEPVSPSEQEALLRKLEESQRSRVLTLPTSLNQVALLDRLNAPIPETNLDHVNNLPPIVSETRLKNGKRRITPQLLQPSNVPPSASTESYTMIIGKPARKAWLKAIPPKRPLNLPSFEITNITGSGCKVIRIHEQKVLWEERFETTFTAAAVSNEGTLFLALSSCRLMILSGAGRRLFPPILLSSMVTQLAITEDLCAALLDNGLFYTWYGDAHYINL